MHWNHLHKTSAQIALGKPLAHSPYVWERPRWEKGKGVFLEQIHIWAGLCLLNTLSLRQRKLLDACLVQFVTAL